MGVYRYMLKISHPVTPYCVVIFIFEYAKKRRVSSGSHDEFIDYIFGNVAKSLRISVALGKNILKMPSRYTRALTPLLGKYIS